MRDEQRVSEFTEYADARRTYLRRTAYLVCGDWHAADDLVQTALVKMYTAWPKIRSRGAEDSYARRIIVRAFLDEKRRPWRRERVGLDGFDRPSPSGMSFEERDELLQALDDLPLRQRATIVLRYWCDLSVEETATELGCSTGTVKSQTSRAMDTLRAAMSSPEEATAKVIKQ